MSYAGLGIQTLEQRRRRFAQATENQRDLARTLYNAGTDAYEAGNFTVAIRYYIDSWAQVPNPDVLISIGLTMMRLGQFQDASYRFARYLRENPDGSERARRNATTYLAEATAALTQQAAAQTPPAPPPPRPPEVSAASVAAVTKSAAQIASSAPRPRDPYAESTVGIWVATGIGVVTIAGLGWWLTRRKPKPNRRRRRRR